MYIRNANFCLGEASHYQEPDMYLCSQIEKVALKLSRKLSCDFKKEGAQQLRLYCRVYDCADYKDGSLVVTREVDRIVFDEKKTAYACFGDKCVKIESFNEAFKQNLMLLASSALARQMVCAN